jgi:predicted GTPase
MLVVLNHIDEVPMDRREAMIADLQRLLDQDGLDGVPVVSTSALTRAGIPELKDAIATRVSAKRLTQTRLLIDVNLVALRLRRSTAPPTRRTSPGRGATSWSTRSPTRRGCRRSWTPCRSPRRRGPRGPPAGR